MEKIGYKISIGICSVVFLFLSICQPALGSGDLDPAFDPGIGPDGYVLSTAIQADGKILILGPFTSVDEVSRKNIARLESDGPLHTSFTTGPGANIGLGSNIAIQDDGKILVGGDFTSYSGNTAVQNVVRLNTDGTVDTSFSTGDGPSSSVYAIAVQDDGKILIGGDFSDYAGTSREGIARLNSDGTLDTGFDPGNGTDATVWSITVQDDGKIIIAGDFSLFDGVARSGIARLNSDGTLDTGFDSSTGTDWSVWATAIQTDGKIIIGGDFTTYDQTGRNRIARLNSDGTLDTSFDPGSGFNSYINFNAIRIQSDEKIIAAGNFTSYDSTDINYIARLNADGTLDSDFNSDSGPDDAVNMADIQSDGDLIIGGWFSNFNDSTAPYIARITGSDPVLSAGEQMQAAYLTGDIAIVGENPANTSAVTFNVEFTLEVGDANVVFPAGTVMTKTGGGAMDITQMVMEDIAESLRNTYVGDIAGAVSIGIPSLNLSFSENITVTIPVGASYNGQTLNIYYQNEGESNWTGGLTCLVADGLCIFETNHATNYSAGDEPSEEDEEAQKADIDSWSAALVTDLSSCPEKLELTIKGHHFDSEAEVKIGSRKASNVDVDSSKKITARFCLKKLLKAKISLKREIKVTNPDADTEKAKKKIDLGNLFLTSPTGFDPKTPEGVRSIQSALVKLGYLDAQYITGFYGPITTEAVKKFQADNGLPQVGIVGPLTKAMLGKKVK